MPSGAAFPWEWERVLGAPRCLAAVATSGVTGGFKTRRGNGGGEKC